ncbi:MAG: zinc-ribbon and DUF3426 domain-containing protein [Proteobacteria bacterium]|nr:zinc-ribbon and DUF3426 domain-containing protein [Pseudomonadota bacterium]
MYSQCPECLTIYKVGAAMLAQSHGSVRCGHCNAVFDALRSLTEQLPDDSVRHLLAHPGDDAPPQLTVPAMRPATGQQQALLFDPDERPARTTQPKRPHTPAFARTRHVRPVARNWPWALGTLGLLLTLLAQIGYAERAVVLDDARLRPVLDSACVTLGCRLPLRHDPAKLELLSRDIRPHPSVPNALIVSATLRNDAAFAQAFPDVEITLSDLDENRIAMRRFRPQEYIADTRSLAAGLAPGATAALVFEVADPGKNAVAFEFKFF